MAAETESWLAEGVAAARAGQAPRARALLERVLESDGGNVRAWYWLSRIADTPQERLTCLENVLRLDPGHAGVQAEAAALRREMSAAEKQRLLSRQSLASAVPATAAEDLAAAAAVEPLACPFCGAVTPAAGRLCPACGRRLVQRRRKSAGHSVYSLLLVMGWFFLANYVWLGLAAFYFAHSLAAAAQASPATQSSLRTLGSLLGREAGPGPAWLDWPLAPSLLLGGLAFGLSLLVAWGLARRLGFFYWLTITLLLAYPLSLVYRLASGGDTSVLRLLPGVVGWMLVLSAAFMAHDEYAWVEIRLDAGVDRDVHSPSALYARGRDHARQGMWAKAATHWSRAVAGSPGHPDYRLALAGALMNLGQTERAREHLLATQRIDPEHAEISRLLAALEIEPPHG